MSPAARWTSRRPSARARTTASRPRAAARSPARTPPARSPTPALRPAMPATAMPATVLRATAMPVTARRPSRRAAGRPGDGRPGRPPEHARRRRRGAAARTSLRRQRTAGIGGLLASPSGLWSLSMTKARNNYSEEGPVTTAPDDQQLAPVLARGGDAQVLPVADMLFQRLLRNRIIFLGQQVDDDLANRVCAELILLAAEDDKRDISLYINSPGGSVYAGLAIYDVMQYVRNDVATYAMGMAASMGQFLLCAGAQGKRYAMPHAAVLMHQPHGGIGGTATDIRIQAEHSLYLKRVLAERTALHTGQTVEQIEADSDRDRWFTADEAKDYGFVDHVVRSATEVPSVGPVS